MLGSVGLSSVPLVPFFVVYVFFEIIFVVSRKSLQLFRLRCIVLSERNSNKVLVISVIATFCVEHLSRRLLKHMPKPPQ